MRMKLLLCSVLIVCMMVLPASSYSVMNDSNVFRHHDNGCMKIAITFDDGPSPKYTADILDYLKEEEIHATFFVVGSMARLSPELLRREEAEGHEIGNHTDSHPRLSKLPIATTAAACADGSILRREIEDCARTVYETTEIRTTLFRPPEGYCTEAISAAAKDMDYRIILWNIDTRDWDHAMADDIAANILNNVTAGDIILFHDCVSRKDSQTLAALKKVVPVLKERGYQFVTVSELIDTKNA
ncbi:MAG: polysaccharide deacetylase family protein [Clostridia bacterium]|nr:polysaccharide deacetylase family protein [Clostridia bacterium]